METDDDLFLGMVESVTRDVLDRIGNGADARYAFLRRFLDLAQEVGRSDHEQIPLRRKPLAKRLS